LGTNIKLPDDFPPVPVVPPPKGFKSYQQLLSMAIRRMTALKVRTSDIINGKWVKQEGMEPSFVKTSSGVEISRARIMGTIVSKFVSDDGNFASITLDDSTETIRAKTFKTVKPLDTVEVGNTVDLIGKVREYNGEIYLIPEVVVKVADPNMEILRKVEIMKHSGAETVSANEEAEKADKKEGSDSLRMEIIKVIEQSGKGVSYNEIMKSIKAPEEDIEAIVNELLSEGICYEPTPGKIRKI
jgi:RPA family protein